MNTDDLRLDLPTRRLSTHHFPQDNPPEYPDHAAQKAALRRSLLKARQKMPPEIWRHKSDRLCDHLLSSVWLTEAKTVLAYFSFRQEPDLSPLFSLPNSPYQWGLPRCVERTLIWHLWSSEQACEPGAYGIPEPAAAAPTLSATEVDLILVPCVACDVRGYRLGYGGGFYDRLLSDPAWNKIPTIGIVFEFARLPSLPVEAWDRPLQAICTESGLSILKQHAAKTATSCANRPSPQSQDAGIAPATKTDSPDC